MRGAINRRGLRPGERGERAQGEIGKIKLLSRRMRPVYIYIRLSPVGYAARKVTCRKRTEMLYAIAAKIHPITTECCESGVTAFQLSELFSKWGFKMCIIRRTSKSWVKR